MLAHMGAGEPGPCWLHWEERVGSTDTLQLLVLNFWGRHLGVTTPKGGRMRLGKSGRISEYGPWHVNRHRARCQVTVTHGTAFQCICKGISPDFDFLFFFSPLWGLIVVWNREHKIGQSPVRRLLGCCRTRLHSTHLQEFMRNTLCSAQVVRDTVQGPKIKYQLKNMSDHSFKFRCVEETLI